MQEKTKRNTLKAKVKSVTPKNDDIEVVVDLTNKAEITSVISNEVANKLNLSPDEEIYINIVASNVMLSKDEF